MPENLIEAIVESNNIYYPNTQDQLEDTIEKNKFEWENIAKSKSILTKYGKMIFVRDMWKQWYINGNYLISKRITRAKQLLRFTDMTVDEVGAAVGMGDANYFSRMFRKVEGISPREYRKQW